ncbi:MAG: peptide deformylase [Actinomycetota bacterium]
MSFLDIHILGDPVLRSVSKPVTTFDEDLERLAQDMLDTMHAAPGVGLAAPQVGRLIRMFVFDSGESSGAVVNPSIVWSSEETQESDEGCLSVPEIYIPVIRAMSVRVEAQTVKGEPVVWECTGFESRIFQHETDHLDGIMFIDRLTDERRKEAWRLIREAGIEGRPPRRPAPAEKNL